MSLNPDTGFSDLHRMDRSTWISSNPVYGLKLTPQPDGDNDPHIQRPCIGSELVVKPHGHAHADMPFCAVRLRRDMTMACATLARLGTCSAGNS